MLLANAPMDDEVTSIRMMNPRTLRPTSRGKIIGNDPQVRQVLSTIDRVAKSTCTVLVTGESGTGKELVIAALHDASDRRGAPLVTINCGAIPLDLVESELFGHVKGAFTGAQANRRGHVATAEGGTLFLDEVGELPLSVQVKLLRLLQQREYTPVGESRSVKCDVRIVAATNRDLEAEVRAGRFREDLFYRLNVIHIHLPALRERRGDVRLLAGHFFSLFTARTGRVDLVGISATAYTAIEGHKWPGNVRALENAMERGVLLARGPYLEAEDILGCATGKRAASPVAPSVAVPQAALAHPAAQAHEAAQAHAAVQPRAGQPRTTTLPSMGAVADPRREPETQQSPVVFAKAPAHMRAGPGQVGPSPSPAAGALGTLGPASSAKPSVTLPRSPFIGYPPPVVAVPTAPPSLKREGEVGAVPVVATIPSVRRPSDPAFPRVLPNQGVDLFSAVESYQNNLIRQALARTGGNKNRAAQLLGLNRTTLVEMIRRRGL